MTERRWVDHRESPMAKQDAGMRVHPQALVVGAAVAERGEHALERPPPGVDIIAIREPQASYSTHVRTGNEGTIGATCLTLRWNGRGPRMPHTVLPVRGRSRAGPLRPDLGGRRPDRPPRRPSATGDCRRVRRNPSRVVW